MNGFGTTTFQSELGTSRQFTSKTLTPEIPEIPGRIRLRDAVGFGMSFSYGGGGGGIKISYNAGAEDLNYDYPAYTGTDIHEIKSISIQ